MARIGSQQRSAAGWGVARSMSRVGAIIVSLVGIPALILTEFHFGLALCRFLGRHGIVNESVVESWGIVSIGSIPGIAVIAIGGATYVLVGLKQGTEKAWWRLLWVAAASIALLVAAIITAGFV